MNPLPNHRILLIDDNEAIHADIRKVLGGPRRNPSLAAAEAVLFDAPPAPASTARAANFEIDSAYQGAEGLAKVIASIAAGRPYAMAFVDVRMPPGMDGIETIALLWKADPALQIVLCTAHSDYSWEKMTARLGVSENLLILKKPFDNIEVLQFAHALAKKWEMTRQAALRVETLDEMVLERTRHIEHVNAELSRSEERFSKAFRSSPFPSAIQHLSSDRFLDVNDAFLRMSGFSLEELVGHTPLELRLLIDYEVPLTRGVDDSRALTNLEAQISTRSGDVREVLISREPISVAAENHVLLMIQDVTEPRRVENQLRQAQKMEAVGQLAAGVAHDFNNLLTIIEGHASLQLSIPGANPAVMESLAQIERAAERAAELTRKLLTFSRRQILRPRVLNLNAVVRELGAMLGRLIGESIRVGYELAEPLPAVFADPSSVEQILMNLAVNARDAMPRGGTLTISTLFVEIEKDGPPCGENGPRAGAFVCIRIRDTGTGMDAATCRHIFEPFFTTKDVDKGTGMGLATVYGIVKQHEGWIDVHTAPGKGATFSIYLPRTEKAYEPVVCAPVRVSHALTRSHTLLVVEDDEAVRGLVREILGSDGYHVLEATNADHALELWQVHGDQIELILTDMVMPGSANGIELAAILRCQRPDLKVIYTSGYSSELFISDLPMEEGVNYLPKPYLSSALVDILRDAFAPAEAVAV